MNAECTFTPEPEQCLRKLKFRNFIIITFINYLSKRPEKDDNCFRTLNINSFLMYLTEDNTVISRINCN